MENVKIEEIANELGMQNRELLKRVQLLYSDIKSPKSKVTPQIAQEIFDTIVLGKHVESAHNNFTFFTKNINLSFSSDKIDISMLEKIASTYKAKNIQEFMIRSFTFSELSIVKILTAGLVNLDIKQYVELKSSNKELSQLLENMNKIIDDVDFENIDNKNPLDNFEYYLQKHQPEIVYIEGIDYSNYKKYREVFKLIKHPANKNRRFEIGFSGVASNNITEIIEEFNYAN